MSDKTFKVFKSPHVWDIEVAFVKKFSLNSRNFTPSSLLKPLIFESTSNKSSLICLLLRTITSLQLRPSSPCTIS